ncbi:MAG: hypothetical protein MJZ64_07605 [Paludibacteraceae bacterium]|nr:hypothetical protein [Paludibacteraceae bacterium]
MTKFQISILLCLFAFCLSSCEKKVYICTGPQSKCYHKKKHCRGLRSCSGDIKQITLDEAQHMHRRECHYCY